MDWDMETQKHQNGFESFTKISVIAIVVLAILLLFMRATLIS